MPGTSHTRISRGDMLGIWYLSTRSEAWLDLDTSQLWCFSWAFASFSAAAIGHPERLQVQKGDLMVSSSSSVHMDPIAPSPPLPGLHQKTRGSFPHVPWAVLRGWPGGEEIIWLYCARFPLGLQGTTLMTVPCIRHTQPFQRQQATLCHSGGHERAGIVDTESSLGRVCRWGSSRQGGTSF